jgi:hypothetical protein
MGPAALRHGGRGVVPSLVCASLLGLVPACSPTGESVSGFRGAGVVHDFGTVFEGAVLEHAFELEVAPGARPTVEAARADCGCTVARLEVAGPGDLPRRAYTEGTALEPGTRLFVTLRYDTRGKVGDAPRTLSIYTNPAGKLEVAVRARVEPWLVATPDRFDLPPLDEELARELDFVVESAGGEPFRLTPTGLALPPEVRVSTAPRGGGERAATWDVRVELGPKLPRGMHAWPIELVTDVPVPVPPGSAPAGEPPRSFALAPLVNVQVVGAIVPSLPGLSFGAVRGGEVVSRSVRLTCTDAAVAFEEPRATLAPARDVDRPLERCTAVHVKRAPEGNAWDVELVLTDLDPALEGTFLGYLVVETNHPRDPRIEIPVTGFRVDAGSAAAPERNPGTEGRLAGPRGTN